MALKERILTFSAVECEFCGTVYADAESAAAAGCNGEEPAQTIPLGTKVYIDFEVFDRHQKSHGFVYRPGLVAAYERPRRHEPAKSIELRRSEVCDHPRMIGINAPITNHDWIVRIDPLVPDAGHGLTRTSTRKRLANLQQNVEQQRGQ